MSSPTLLGILGGGQLGWMLAIAARKIGVECRAWDLLPGTPASREAELIIGKFYDAEVMKQFTPGLRAVTYEWENVPIAAVEKIRALGLPVFPDPAALKLAQDRLDQKARLNAIGIATAPFSAVDSAEDLRAALKKIGYPAVLKTRREGYDGKGQAVIRTEEDAEGAFEKIGSVPAILEGWVPFEVELSIVSVRGQDGSLAFYPLSRNVHRDGILRTTWVPAADANLQAQAEAMAKLALEKFSPAAPYVGVMTLELFLSKGKLMVNEIATRVHNTGHWTIEGAQTSQFENHVRAGLGMPLGRTQTHGPVAMVNLIGTQPDLELMEAVPGATVHLYGKEPRPGRKLGHVTIQAPNETELKRCVDVITQLCVASGN